MARRARDRHAILQPRSVTILGELGEWVFRNDAGPFGVPYRGGKMLCSSADGRTMYILRPISDGGPVRRDAFVTNARGLELYERFQHRRADAMFNTFCPPFRRPRHLGQLVLLSYYTAKGRDQEAEHVHYFEEPGVAPAWPAVLSVGFGQYVITPGRWKVTDDGIDFYRGDD